MDSKKSLCCPLVVLLATDVLGEKNITTLFYCLIISAKLKLHKHSVHKGSFI